MLRNSFFQSRRLLLFLSLGVLFLILNHIFTNSSKDIHLRSLNQRIQEKKLTRRLIEINDRQPSYKLYICDGYEIPLEHNRAQAKLLDSIKLHDKCQQNPKFLVIDVGASLGQFGLYAAACGCQVYMFEVDPLKLDLLEASIKVNSFESRITLIPKAVTDLPSGTKLYISWNTSRQVSMKEGEENSDVYSVDTISLNQLNFSSDIYLLHVNVGGYEIRVMRASEKLFRENLVHHVLFQYTPAGSDQISQNDILPYIRDILGGRRFYTLHRKQEIIYGPLHNEDIDQFYTQNLALNLERDVYVLFQDEDLDINSIIYNFPKSSD